MLEKYYKVLGITFEADEKALKKAFRNLALKLHPDVNKSPDAKEKFQELCEAYEIVLQQIRFETTVSAGSFDHVEEDTSSYEEIIREARRKAYERAKIKYDKMKAEKEFFEESNWRDVFLILKYTGRVVALPLAAFLVIFPLIVAINNGILMFFALFFFWIIGGIILNQYISNRSKWFKLGRIRWKLRDLINLFNFNPVTKDPDTYCYYCEGRKADGKKFLMTLLKVKDVRIRNDGVYQHYVAYDRKYKEVIFPRSTKAFIVHYFQSLIKILSLIFCVIWLPYPSLIWRFAGGLVLGLILSTLVCGLTHTRSKVSYLLNTFQIIKISVWAIVVMTQTTLYPGMILQTTVYAPIFLVVLLIFGDIILDFILKLMPFYSRIYIPVTTQSPNILNFYRNGYQNYLDVPVWSTIYPLVRWFV
jgi:hypothetical protein